MGIKYHCVRIQENREKSFVTLKLLNCKVALQLLESEMRHTKLISFTVHFIAATLLKLISTLSPSQFHEF